MNLPSANSSDILEVVMTTDQLIMALHELRDELLKSFQVAKEYSAYVKSVSGDETGDHAND